MALELPSLVFALGGFFIAVSGLLGGSVGVWDFLYEIPCKPGIRKRASGGVDLRIAMLAGGWIVPAGGLGCCDLGYFLPARCRGLGCGVSINALPAAHIQSAPRDPRPLLPHDGGGGVRCVNSLFGGSSCRSVGFVWGEVGLCLPACFACILNTVNAPQIRNEGLWDWMDSFCRCFQLSECL